MTQRQNQYQKPYKNFERLNLIGLYTLYLKEIKRFTTVWAQTLAAPVITNLLLLSVFSLALGRATETVRDLPFLVFIAPGLVMMGIVQNAFANTASSLVGSKMLGNIVDVLLPPLSAGEFVTAYVLAAATRALIIGTLSWAAMSLFIPLNPSNVFIMLFYAVSASIMLGLLGMLTGMWSEKFDHMSAITNFVIMPLSFLSGTFYPIERLPEIFQQITRLNPFYYMIDGFRYGITGYTENPIMTGIFYLTFLNISMWLFIWQLVRRGYKLKI